MNFWHTIKYGTIPITTDRQENTKKTKANLKYISSDKTPGAKFESNTEMNLLDTWPSEWGQQVVYKRLQ